jgi:hypothetical protein
MFHNKDIIVLWGESVKSCIIYLIKTKLNNNSQQYNILQQQHPPNSKAQKTSWLKQIEIMVHALMLGIGTKMWQC